VGARPAGWGEHVRCLQRSLAYLEAAARASLTPPERHRPFAHTRGEAGPLRTRSRPAGHGPDAVGELETVVVPGTSLACGGGSAYATRPAIRAQFETPGCVAANARYRTKALRGPRHGSRCRIRQEQKPYDLATKPSIVLRLRDCSSEESTQDGLRRPRDSAVLPTRRILIARREGLR
jgi:hypothetical protein